MNTIPKINTSTLDILELGFNGLTPLPVLHPSKHSSRHLVVVRLEVVDSNGNKDPGSVPSVTYSQSYVVIAVQLPPLELQIN